MSSWSRKAAIALVAILGATGVVALLHAIGGKSELERYKSALRAKGERLSFKELSAPLSRSATHIISRQVLASNSLATGLAPVLMQYVGPGRVSPAWRGNLRLGLTTNMVTGDWKVMEQQMESDTSKLAKIQQALADPSPDTGWVHSDVYSNVIVGPPRTFARDNALGQALVRYELVELHRGNLDGALTDLHSLAGLAQMNSNELFLVLQMLRVSVSGYALQGVWEALQAPGWDDPRLASVQNDWEHVELLEGMEKSFLAERAFFQVIMTQVRRTDGKELSEIVNPSFSGTSAPKPSGTFFENVWKNRLSPIAYKWFGANEDELVQLQFASGLVDTIRFARSNHPWPEVNAAVFNLYSDLNQKVAQDKYARLKVTCLAIPNWTRSFETVVKTETLRRLTLTAIALKRYELRNGRSPESLAALSPDYLRLQLLDPMSGKGFGYRVNPTGGYVLYSAGLDGKDDGGDPNPVRPDSKPGFWEGRDAVWPAANAPVEESVAASALKRN
jgi:hypothetical protein